MDISKLRFLIVDDSQMIREVIEKLLREIGAVAVDKVPDGKDALNHIKRAFNEKRPYALVTLDWEMPEVPGIEVLKAVRADPAMKSLPILMVSTKADADHITQLAPFMPHGFVVKPFTAEVLKERVLTLLQATQK